METVKALLNDEKATILLNEEMNKIKGGEDGGDEMEIVGLGFEKKK